MDFSDALHTLKAQEPMTRDAWDGQNKSALMIPGELGTQTRFVQVVGEEQIPYDPNTEDILAEDWKVPTPPADDNNDGGVIDTGAEGAGTGGG